MDANFDHATEDLWVFGYGSLMWRPGFASSNAHRHMWSACTDRFASILGHAARPEKPGLVLGLDRGGACRELPIVWHIRKSRQRLPTLRDRELMAEFMSIEAMRKISLAGNPRSVQASATSSTEAIRNMPDV